MVTGTTAAVSQSSVVTAEVANTSRDDQVSDVIVKVGGCFEGSDSR